MDDVISAGISTLGKIFLGLWAFIEGNNPLLVMYYSIPVGIGISIILYLFGANKHKRGDDNE